MLLSKVYNQMESHFAGLPWQHVRCEATLSCQRLQRRCSVRMSSSREGGYLIQKQHGGAPIDITEPKLAQKLITNRRHAMQYNCIKLSISPAGQDASIIADLLAGSFAIFKQAVAAAVTPDSGHCHLWVNFVMDGGRGRWSAWYLPAKDEWWADPCNPQNTGFEPLMLGLLEAMNGSSNSFHYLRADRAWDRHMLGMYRPLGSESSSWQAVAATTACF